MKMTQKFCFKCFCEGTQKQVGSNYFMFALDVPYANLFFHRDCFENIKHEISLFITQNEKSFYNYIEKL